MLVIPPKYLEVLESLDEYMHFTSLAATEANWQMVREKLVTGYWMEHWCTDDNDPTAFRLAGDKLPTMRTEFYALSFDRGEAKFPTKTFTDGKFIRLNSLSSKTQICPAYSMDCVSEMLETERCQSSCQLAGRVRAAISIVVRDWIDMSVGVEWRCFVYDGRIRAISLNDTAISPMDEAQVISRVSELFARIQYDIPCVDCVMDVWLHDTDASLDLVIEFNSYGFWGNAGIEKFDWIEDAALLYGLSDGEIAVRS